MKILKIALMLSLVCCTVIVAADRPNILWLTSEDNGPHMGAYGDDFADTPNLDRLAEQGMIYLNAWSTAPVCAPARTTIISGVYPPCTGSEHMRSMLPLPDNMKMYPQYLREAGYYCTNASKEDYNLVKPGQVWDESSRNAHWRNRKPGQPFFAIFNMTTTHESQIRKRPHTPVHEPAKVTIPAYHPDTPEVRRDWAQYYDKMTEMDAQMGEILRQLAEDGLTDNTIIMYYGDHGPGMPRGKRWPYNSGLRVPLIAYFPHQYKHLATPDYTVGGESDRLVGFIDLAPTLLSIAGIKPPEHMQGYAFHGEYQAPEQPFIYGFRGRMDERYDMLRVVRDKRYHYMRNYMPHKIYGQYIEYMFQTPTTQVWKQMYDDGKLSPPMTHFWETKPAEELYDLWEDPDEVNNLANSPEHQDILKKLRKAQQELALKIRDVGFLPEGEVHSRSKGSTPYEMGHNDRIYPMKKIMDMAEKASSLKMEDMDDLIKGFDDSDSAVRYWAAMGVLMREQKGADRAKSVLNAALKDDAPPVQIIAAEVLGRYGTSSEAEKALQVLLKLVPANKDNVFHSMLALGALNAYRGKLKPYEALFRAQPLEIPGAHSRVDGYFGRLLTEILENIDE
jgi:arylsulfatase A-like enzyme